MGLFEMFQIFPNPDSNRSQNDFIYSGKSEENDFTNICVSESNNLPETKKSWPFVLHSRGERFRRKCQSETITDLVTLYQLCMLSYQTFRGVKKNIALTIARTKKERTKKLKKNRYAFVPNSKLQSFFTVGIVLGKTFLCWFKASNERKK